MNHHLIEKLASKSTHRCHHVAIVERGGAILSLGYNHDGIHAEHVALNKLWVSERNGVRVWSLRLMRNGTFGMAKPCINCERYLRENGVRAVVYTDVHGQLTKMQL